MKKNSLKFFLLFSISLAQNFDPNTGKLIEDQFDPDTGEKIEADIDPITSLELNKPNPNNTVIRHFDESDFEDLYNNETIYPAPPWYGHSVSSKYFKAKKGSYLLNRDEIEEELLKYPKSEDILKDHRKWLNLSFLSLGATIMVPIIFSSVDVEIYHILSFYGGVGFTIYCINKFTKKWYEAIWVYNRENIKAQLKSENN